VSDDLADIPVPAFQLVTLDIYGESSPEEENKKR